MLPFHLTCCRRSHTHTWVQMCTDKPQHPFSVWPGVCVCVCLRKRWEISQPFVVLVNITWLLSLCDRCFSAACFFISNINNSAIIQPGGFRVTCRCCSGVQKQIVLTANKMLTDHMDHRLSWLLNKWINLKDKFYLWPQQFSTILHQELSFCKSNFCKVTVNII